MSQESRRGVLELAAEYFEEQLWHSETGAGARRKMERWGFQDETLRSFGLGYAPGRTRAFVDQCKRTGFSPQDLVAAGLAGESERGGIHVRFHARIMFPVRDGDGSLQGFAGLATHLGPSWPLWLASPDEPDGFHPASALFGFDQARDAIAREGRALVLRDPVQVLALHQDGRAEAVADTIDPEESR